jgi:hypothetical protein
MTDPLQSYDFATFAGYAIPNTTQIPDEFIDKQMAFLSGAEVKVMLYVFRRTLGFKRHADNISLNQLLSGITKRDGTRLDYGTGLSKSTLLGAIKSLVERKLIIVEQRQSDERGNEPTTYRLNFATPLGIKNDLGVSENQTPLGTKNDLGGDRKLDQALVPKIDPTIDSNTTHSETRNRYNNNTYSAPVPSHAVVVALLAGHGIGKGVAQSLANQFPEDHIKEKVAYLEFLLAERPTDVQKPAAWLRRAIEHDYGAPDGFISEEERQLQATEEDRRKREVYEAQQRAAEREQAARAEAAASAAARRQQIHATHATSPDDIALWSELQQHLISVNERAVAALLADTTILSREGSVLRVGVWHAITANNLSHPRTTALIKNHLKIVAHEPLEVAFTVLEPTA